MIPFDYRIFFQMGGSTTNLYSFAQPSKWRGFLSEPKSLFGWINHKMMVFCWETIFCPIHLFGMLQIPFHVIDFGRKWGHQSPKLSKFEVDGFGRAFTSLPSLHGKQNLRIDPVNQSWKGFLGVFSCGWKMKVVSPENMGYNPSIWRLRVPMLSGFDFFSMWVPKNLPCDILGSDKGHHGWCIFLLHEELRNARILKITG